MLQFKKLEHIIISTMGFTPLVSVITLAIISKNVNCTEQTDIKFIKDFISYEESKSVSLTAFLCWAKADKLALINEMLQINILAIIYDVKLDYWNEFEVVENILYLIDLDCENYLEILSKANSQNLFASPKKWIFLTRNEDYVSNVDKYFLKYDFYVDSNINLVQRSSNQQYDLTEIYKYGYSSTFMQKNKISKWFLKEGFTNVKTKIISARRQNVNGILLKSTFVILNNDSFNHLTDYRFKHIDSITKVNIIFTNHLYDYINATKEYDFVNSWGYLNKEDNMYTGMIGNLQRNKSEIGGSPLFLTYDRVSVIDYIATTTPTRAKFIFRQPPLSYVTNVFTLPFSQDVWLSSLGLCVIISVLLYIAVLVEWHQTMKSPENKTATSSSFVDAVMLTIGAVAQQGATNEPRNAAGRIVTLFTFTALMFLYVSYSANIVALLQSSATNIRTLEDLLNSRLKLGVEDNIYNHYYFETATEPIRKAIFEKKVAPKGQKSNFFKADEGVLKIKEGFFAFHGESSVIYTLIGQTFYETEKCGIQEIQYIQTVEPYMAIKKNSSYKEILKIGLRKIQESGIQSRELQKLYTKKPECHSSGGNFVSVGLIDVYSAFLVLGTGAGFALLLFCLEVAANNRKIFYY